MRNKSIVGKVVVINAEPKRYEFQHAAYQLVLAEGGNGATGGRDQAVFGTCLATSEHSRWERYDVLGEIKPERMSQWAKDALKAIKKHVLDDFLLYCSSDIFGLFAILFGIWPKRDLGCGSGWSYSSQFCSCYNRDSFYKEERKH